MITATAVAPARITRACGSSVMPPIATSSPVRGGAASARRVASHARGRPPRSRSPSSRSRTPARPRHSEIGSQHRRVDLLFGVRRQSDDGIRSDDRPGAAGERSSCPTWTPSAPASRAMSARSLTTRIAPADERQCRGVGWQDRESRSGKRLGANLQTRAPPSRQAAARSTGVQPARAATSTSTIAWRPLVLDGRNGIYTTREDLERSI